MEESGSKKSRSKVTLSKLTFHKLNWLEYVAMILAFWFLLYPKPYNILFSVLLCMPVLGLILNGINGRPSIASLVTISRKDGDDKYDVADFIDLPGWIIALRVLLDYEFESYYSLIIPGIVACVLMLVLLFVTHNMIVQTDKSKWWIYASLIFNVCLYSCGATYGANCVYDRSAPAVYKAEVADMHIYSGKHTSHYVTVAPWGHHHDKEDIRVSSDQYDEIQVGETVNIDLHRGLFNIPWYYIERK